MNQHLGTNRYCFLDLSCDLVIINLLKIQPCDNESIEIQQASYSSPLQQGVGVGIQPRTTGDCTCDVYLIFIACLRMNSYSINHSSLFTKPSFQHALESLVDRVCAAQRGKEFLYKRDSQGKLVTRQSRLADPNHGTAIKSFRKAEDQKSKLPHKLWEKKRVETLVM